MGVAAILVMRKGSDDRWTNDGRWSHWCTTCIRFRQDVHKTVRHIVTSLVPILDSHR